MKKIILLASAMLACYSGNAQTYTPITLTGFNADVIANGSGSAMTSTTHDMDGIMVLVAQNFVNPSNQSPAAGTALPNNGLITSAVTTTPGLTFQLAPYTGNNVLRIAGNSSGTVTFATPISTSDLYVLLTPVAYSGTIPTSITVNFTDGTNQVFSGIVLNNWFGGTGAAYNGTTRVNRSSNVFDVQTIGPKMWQQKLTMSAANASKSIQSILVNNNSPVTTNDVIHVMAVTAITPLSTLATDAGITAITAPNSGCALTSAETITVTVKNHGTAPQTNIPVSYKINATGTPVTEFIPSLAANTSMTYSFATKANLSTVGTYNLEVRTNLTGDLAPTNDVLSRTIVLAAAPATPSISPSTPPAICSGGSVTLTATSATPGATFQWFNNGTAITGANASSYAANATGSYTVTALSSGCSSPVSAAVALTMNTTPVAPGINAGGSLAICIGGSVALTASSATSGATFTWFQNGNVIPGATAATYTATTAGNYTAVATVNGCSSAASLARTVTITQAPATPTVTRSGFVLTSSSVSGNQWYKNSVLIAGATAKSYLTTSNGAYTVVATSNGCPSAPSSAVTIANTGINDEEMNLAVAVHPNPSTGLFQISLPKGKGFEMTITDLSGKVILKEKANAKTTQLDLHKAAKGIYILKLESEGKTATRKLVVE